MRRAPTQVTGVNGTQHVSRVVESELHWIFRGEPVQDFGIDAQAEVVSTDQIVTGRLIALQIKSGDSWFKNPTKKGWTFYESDDHLAYWLGHSLRVVVVLVNSKSQAYWQVVNTKTVRETDSGFALDVPKTNRLDGSALAKLTELAGRSRGLVETLPALYEQLPSDAVNALRKAESVDPLGAARLADRLVEGSDTPAATTELLLAASPTWLSSSDAAQELWRALGAFAAQHEVNLPAARALERSADFGGHAGARARAFAGLCLLWVDQVASRDLLERARKEGAVLLADMGLAILEIPPDAAKPVVVPESIRSADAATLDAEPTILNFLGENALRLGDLDAAVELRERAVAAATTEGSGVHLELARTIWRRAFEGGQATPRERRRAVELAKRAVEDRRRWRGPSVAALRLYLDIELTGGDARAGLLAALPSSEGGTAEDSEATHEQIARRGGLLSLLSNDSHALHFFLRVLPPGTARDEVLAVQEDVSHGLRPEAIARWTQLLEESSGDDEMATRCIARLTQQGVWPAQVEDLHDRSVLPDHAFEAFRAMQRGYSGEVDVAVARLRELADEQITAAVQLVTLLERLVGIDEATAECEHLLKRWQDPLLGQQLVDLLRRSNQNDVAAEYVSECVTNEAYSDDVRLRFCDWLARFRASSGALDEAIATARIGLGISDDPDLAWILTVCQYNSGRVQDARETLRRYRPTPARDDEVRLWTQLHLGVPLSHADAAQALDLIDGQPDTIFRDALRGLVVREVVLAPDDSLVPYPAEVLARATEIAAAIEHGPRAGLFKLDGSDEALRSALEHEALDPAEYQRLVERYRAGAIALSDLAARVQHPYGSALLQRPAGLIFATDAESALREAGEAAVAIALDSGPVVADLSALHHLNLMFADDRLVVRAKLSELVVTGSAIVDAVRTQEAIRGLAISTFSARLTVEGSIERVRLTPFERATLRERSTALESIASAQRLVTSPTAVDPLTDSIGVAREEHMVFWCDDSAGRQLARAANVMTFSTLDLISVLANSGASVDADRCRRSLLAEFVVDLPFVADDIVWLGDQNEWRIGAAHTALARAGWWKSREADWESAWRSMARGAVERSPSALPDLTFAALTGGIDAVPFGLATQRFQRIVVQALSACVDAAVNPPLGFLEDLAARGNRAVAPKPQFVLAALAEQLESEGLADPMLTAMNLLPGVDLPT